MSVEFENSVHKTDINTLVIGASGVVDHKTGAITKVNGTQSSAITTPTDLASCITAITAILVHLRAKGEIAT